MTMIEEPVLESIIVRLNFLNDVMTSARNALDNLLKETNCEILQQSEDSSQPTKQTQDS